MKLFVPHMIMLVVNFYTISYCEAFSLHDSLAFYANLLFFFQCLNTGICLICVLTNVRFQRTKKIYNKLCDQVRNSLTKSSESKRLSKWETVLKIFSYSQLDCKDEETQHAHIYFKLFPIHLLILHWYQACICSTKHLLICLKEAHFCLKTHS